MAKTTISCVQYRDGSKYLDPDAPWNLDMDAICVDDSTDWRRLDGDIVKKLVANKEKPIAPSGIRILGAVFCEMLDLVGLDLPHSLVIDRSVFKEGIEARNLKIRGDISIDGSLVLKTFKFLRSHVEGTVFAIEAYLERFVAFDAKVEGSIHLRQGMSSLALFDGMTIGGEVSLYGAALSSVLIQLSSIRGSLNLSDTEAKCSYQVRKSDVGELVATDAGFGHLADANLPWVRKRAIVTKIIESLPVRQAKRPVGPCRPNEKLYDFVLYETQVKSSLCVRSFHWATTLFPEAPTSRIVINNTTVGSNAIFNLWPREGRAAAAADLRSRKPALETVGLAAGGLMLNFGDSANLPTTYINGLKFERVYASDTDCPHESYDSNGSPTIVSRTPFVSERSLRSPTVDEVRRWLSINRAKSIQPFTAFIKAFDLAGEDAKPLLIARAATELAMQRGHSPESGTRDDDDATFTGLISGGDATPGVGWLSAFGHRSYIMFRSALGLIADHGYQPVKAVPWIVGLIAACGLLFWFGLGIIGFKSEKSERIFPIGGLFLLDRLIPLYNINEAHRNISTFYRRTKASPDASLAATPAPIVRYFWFTFPVEEASETATRFAEFILALLKILGVVLAVFLVAAVNALVTR